MLFTIDIYYIMYYNIHMKLFVIIIALALSIATAFIIPYVQFEGEEVMNFFNGQKVEEHSSFYEQFSYEMKRTAEEGEQIIGGLTTTLFICFLSQK